jgi:hypothetical protein
MRVPLARTAHGGVMRQDAGGRYFTPGGVS